MDEIPVLLTIKEAPTAGEMLAKAFHDYPLMVWCHPDPEKRKKDLTQGFTRMVRYAIRYGGVLATSPELEGVLVWVRSEKADGTWLRNMLSGNYGLPFGLGGKSNSRQEAYHEYAAGVHRRAISVPHLYLRLLGVAPTFRGRGYAARLLRCVFDLADRESRPCWLETQAEKNVAMYRHLGFEVVEEGTIPGGDVKTWGMLRMPPP